MSDKYISLLIGCPGALHEQLSQVEWHHHHHHRCHWEHHWPVSDGLQQEHDHVVGGLCPLDALELHHHHLKVNEIRRREKLFLELLDQDQDTSASRHQRCRLLLIIFILNILLWSTYASETWNFSFSISYADASISLLLVLLTPGHRSQSIWPPVRWARPSLSSASSPPSSHLWQNPSFPYSTGRLYQHSRGPSGFSLAASLSLCWFYWLWPTLEWEDRERDWQMKSQWVKRCWVWIMEIMKQKPKIGIRSFHHHWLNHQIQVTRSTDVDDVYIGWKKWKLLEIVEKTAFDIVKYHLHFNK